MDNHPIGIFDSGVGGLSVLREIETLLPQESFIYLADQQYAPYGSKTPEELQRRVSAIAGFLVKKGAKMIVIACNTATVYTVASLRTEFSLPIIGVVPVIKTLGEVTRSKKVAVLSTPATSKSDYLMDLINKYGSGCEVFNIGGTGLEEKVEIGEIDGLEIETRLQELLNPLIAVGVDAVALGCTHYPFLKEKIKKIAGKNILVLDSGQAVARQVKRILANNQQLSTRGKTNQYYTTGNEKLFREVAQKLLGKKLGGVEKVTLS